MVVRLANNRVHLEQTARLDPAKHQATQSLGNCTPSNQSQTSKLGAKGDRHGDDGTCQASECYDCDRKESPIRHRFGNDRNRQPMFGVHLTREGGLCWETEADGSGREGIRGNANDERASRHATLELGGRVGKETHLHNSELILRSRRTSSTIESATLVPDPDDRSRT
ncbi:hypothetical protein MHU86_19895 [Fragilaria crotonensis]|nr:hypothetical protein MHU86_19895 [Fragilaria crotonensis]